jgi:hypothetical protein
MRKITRLLAIAVVAAGAASCGDVVRQGRSPVYLVIDSLQGIAGGLTTKSASSVMSSDVITLVPSPAPNCTPASPCPTVFGDAGTAGLRIVLKDIGTPTAPTAPSTNNDVTITRYHVSYRRADGRNVQGVDVPFAFDGQTTVTVRGGTTASVGFELVRNIAKEESPLVQLGHDFNGTIITTFADVTFYGADQVGNEVNVTGHMQIDFGNFGD